MEFFRKLEDSLERLMGLLAGWGDQRSVQPVEIGRQLAKAMLADRRVSTVNVYVPNRFLVHINPADWEKLEPLRLTITEEISQYLADRARSSGVSFAAPVRIEFQTVDGLTKGSVKVEAFFQEGEEHQHTANASGNGEALGDDGEKGDGTQVYKLPSGPMATNPRAELVAISGPQKGQVWMLGDGDTSIGRSPGQHVRLTDPSISRSHAVVRIKQGRYWIEDNNSTNGIKINAKQIKSAILADGDLIELGTTRLQFRMVK